MNCKTSASRHIYSLPVPGTEEEGTLLGDISKHVLGLSPIYRSPQHLERLLSYKDVFDGKITNGLVLILSVAIYVFNSSIL